MDFNAIFLPVLKLRGLRGSGSGANRILNLLAPAASCGEEEGEYWDSGEGGKFRPADGSGMVPAGWGRRGVALPEAEANPPCRA